MRKSLYPHPTFVVKAGFTLVELLVVIAILALLIAILFPAFARAREKARTTTCLSNARHLAVGILLYTQDSDEVFPAACNITAGVNRQYPFLRTLIQPYVKEENIWWCPSEQRPSVWEKVVHPVPTFNNPDFAGAGSSYAYKSRDAVNPSNNRNGNLAGTALADIATPAGIWLFWDADSDYSRHMGKAAGNFDGSTCSWHTPPGQIAAYADGHAHLTTTIPYPQYWENMSLDGQGGSGCTPQ